MTNRGFHEGRRHTTDCPPGMRLLVQILNTNCEAEARLELACMFRKKGAAAILKHGTYQWHGSGPRRFVHEGFRCYLPIGWKP